MKRIKLILLIIFCLIIFLTTNIFAESKIITESTIIIKNVNIVPMNEKKVLKNYSIVVENGEISKIIKSKKLEADQGNYVIDGTDKYIIPGLVDMHVHINGLSDLKLFLANGITKVRNMKGSSGTLYMRKLVEEGDELGPEILTTSPILDGNPPARQQARVLEEPKNATKAVKRYKESGYDYIKVYERLDKDVYNAIITEAKKQKISVVGHVPDKVGIRNVIESGQKSIEHLDNYYSRNKGRIKKDMIGLTVKSNIWNCPTIVVYEGRNKYENNSVEGLQYVPPLTRNLWKSNELYNNYYHLNIMKVITKRLHDKGAKLLLGTDCNNPYTVPGFSVHRELEVLIE